MPYKFLSEKVAKFHGRYVQSNFQGVPKYLFCSVAKRPRYLFSQGVDCVDDKYAGIFWVFKLKIHFDI